MAAEVLYVAAQDNDMPRFLRRATPDDLPVPALVMSTVLVQVVLIITLFSDDAFNFALDLTSTLTLIPFLLAAAFALKISLMHDPLAQRERTGRELSLPPVRGRTPVHPALLHHLRPGHDPFRHGPP